jgi:hypothetical protein
MRDRIFRQTKTIVVDHFDRHPELDGITVHAQQHGDPHELPPVPGDTTRQTAPHVLGGDEVRAPESEIDALMRANPPKSLAELDTIVAKWTANHTGIGTRAATKPPRPKTPPGMASDASA